MRGHSGLSARDVDVDGAELDAFSAAEREALLRWYAETHGEGDLELTRFVPFLIDLRPGALKRFRRNIQAVRSDGDGLPLLAVALLVLHGYVLMGNERGILYEIIAARDWGARRCDVLDVIELAFLEAGPFGVNAVAARSEAYLRAWPRDDDDAGAPDDRWPAGWSVAPAGSWDAGLDHARDELTAQERAALARWYERRGEETPHYVSFLAEHAPAALKTLRSRWEHAGAAAQLPQQLLPLLRLFSGSLGGRPQTVRAAALEARRLGVAKAHLLETVLWSFMSADEAGMSLVTRALDPVLREWP
jgi:hypothetical protein